MKNLMCCALFFLGFFACQKSSLPPVSDCLNDQIEVFKTNDLAVSVLTIENNGEQVYKFRMVEGCGDGEILNGNCEVVCCGGKCVGPRTNCPENPYSDWTIVWEK